MSKTYINQSLKENEEIIGEALVNPVLRIPYLIFSLFFLWLVFSIKFSEISIVILAIDICFFIDTFKIYVALDTTELCFTNMRVIGKTGLINTKSLDAPINKINDISITSGLLGKIFNYSTIIIRTSSSEYFYKYIKDADDFKDELTNYINEYKQKNNNFESKNKEDNYDKLKKLKDLLDNNIISQEEFEKEKQKLLK